MSTHGSMTGWTLGLGGVLAVLLAAGCAGMTPGARLTGNQEVPPVATNSSATADIVVHQTKCPTSTTSPSCPEILGSVYTGGVTATAVEIREGSRGQTGPTVVTLMKVTNDTWTIPPFTFLNAKQYAAFQEGKLYVDVQSTTHPKGELRAQLAP
jgi:hypothetical protein